MSIHGSRRRPALAIEEFDRHAAVVADDQWAASTPCEGWTVRDLVEHVTGGNRFTVALLDGATMAEAFERSVAPGFGDDGAGELHRSAATQLAAFAGDGALGADLPASARRDHRRRVRQLPAR